MRPIPLLVERTFKNFTPRIIANYQITPDMMIYASWSKGREPVAVQHHYSDFQRRNPVAAAAAGVKLAVDPEKITNYEIGLKGTALNGALRYALSGYYAQWPTRSIRSPFVVPIGCPVPDLAAACRIRVGSISRASNLRWPGGQRSCHSRHGRSDQRFHIREFKSPLLSQPDRDIYDYRGKEMPYSSKYSFNIGAPGRQTRLPSWEDGELVHTAPTGPTSQVSGRARPTPRRPGHAMSSTCAQASQGDTSPSRPSSTTCSTTRITPA